MILFTDCYFDDVWSLIYLLKVGKKIDCIVITGNGWNNIGEAFVLITYIVKWFGKNIPVMPGSTHALRDYKNGKNSCDRVYHPLYKGTVPLDALFNISYMYSFVTWLPPVELEQSLYSENFTENIMDIVHTLDSFDILILGSATDPAIMLYLMTDEEIKKINRVFCLGSNVDIKNNVFSIRRSEKSTFNVYSDPDASKFLLSILKEKVYWIIGDVAESVQFNIDEIGALVEKNPTPECLWLYIASQIGGNFEKSAPVGQLPNHLIMWDIIVTILFLFPEYISKQTIECVDIDVNSFMYCQKSDHDTKIVKVYSNDLADINTSDYYGTPTHIVHAMDTQKVLDKFYEILQSQENTALVDLMMPLGNYQYEKITTPKDYENKKLLYS